MLGGVTPLFVFAAPGAPDEHAFNQITKKAITTTRPSETVFHQSRGSLLNTVFIVLLLFFKSRQRRMLRPMRSTRHFTAAWVRISPSGTAASEAPPPLI